MVSRTARRGFSLIELVIVVVIIGIIAAIAIPRMSRGAAGAADSALTANLAVLRNAVDLFQTEHGGYYPTAAQITDALTKYSNDAGNDYVAAKDGTHSFGPYVRVIPPLPVGGKKGNNTITGGNAYAAGGGGWLYDSSTSRIFIANTTVGEVDTAGNLFSTY